MLLDPFFRAHFASSTNHKVGDQNYSYPKEREETQKEKRGLKRVKDERKEVSGKIIAEQSINNQKGEKK